MGCGTGALGKCGTFAQVLVFMVNTVLFAGSVLLVTGSVLLLMEDNSIVQFIDVNNPNQVAYIGICLGSVTAFITFFGCYGSCAQSKKIIRLYLVMLVILFILFITIISLGAWYRNSLKGNLSNGMIQSLHQIKTSNDRNQTDRLRSFWDDMQEKQKCCGNTGYEDWIFDKPDIERVSHIDNQGNQGRDSSTDGPDKTTTDEIAEDKASTSITNTEQGETRRKREIEDIPSTTVQPEYITQEVLDKLPKSCFSNGTNSREELYEDGCRDKAKDWLQFYLNLILIASGGVAIVLVFSIIISCWLLKSVKKALAYNF